MLVVIISFLVLKAQNYMLMLEIYEQEINEIMKTIKKFLAKDFNF